MLKGEAFEGRRKSVSLLKGQGLGLDSPRTRHSSRTEKVPGTSSYTKD
jgi:hypothetical protein